jgi:aldehyde dehydrogenase family 9 protein A1
MLYLQANLEELAKAEVADTGKPIWEARFDVQGCADSLDFFSALALTLFGKTMLQLAELRA